MPKPKGVTLKYIVIGDSGVGKTNLLVRYCEETFHSDYLSTIGVDFKIKRIDHQGKLITLNIWDTAGQERFRNITKSFYKGAHGILLAYSIIDPSSFSHIENWIDQIKQSGNMTMKTILVGTKLDLGENRKVSIEEGQQLAAKYEMGFYQTSAKDNTNVSEVFHRLTSEILQTEIKRIEMEQTKMALKSEKVDEKNGKQCCK